MKRILYIEDEPDQIKVVKERLEANGYEVSSAKDGEEGIEKAKKEKLLSQLTKHTHYSMGILTEF